MQSTYKFPLATALVCAGVTLSPALLQAQANPMYFGAYSPSGRPTAKPYADCQQDTIRGKVLWVCPRLQESGEGVDLDRGASRSGMSDGSSGNMGSGGSSNGMGGNTSSGGMGSGGSSSGMP